MKKILYIITILFFIQSCEDVNLRYPMGAKDEVAPGQLTDVKWEALAGGVKFNYTLPADTDLSYVTAVYEVNGEEFNAKASHFNSELTIVGLPDRTERDIKLYAVDKSENFSNPYIVTVIPDESPVKVMRKSLSHEMDFGGFRIQYKNPSKSEMVIQVYRWDEAFKLMRFYDSRVTTQTEGEYQVIDLPNEKNKFQVVIKDKYNNSSDVYAFDDTPWREVQVDKDVVEYIGAPKVYDKDDWYAWGGRPSNMWDGIVGDWNFAQTAGDGSYPHYICFDLGQEFPIGRILFQQRTGDSEIFSASCPKKFDVYGVAKLPPVNNANPLEGWVKLNNETFEVVRPSGRVPGEPVTEEDRVAARDGIMFTIDTEFPRPEIRYIRFVFTEGFTNNMTIVSELTLWAQWR